LQYHIDTMPVWDAVKLDGECPLCALHRRNELMDIQRFLGASVMEPDVRISVNAKGFCNHHLELLFAKNNRLGLALMLHTHLKETEKTVGSILMGIKSAGKHSGSTLFNRIRSGNGLVKSPMKEAAKALNAASASCVLCDSLHEHMNRYAYTLLYLWERDKDFRKAFSSSKGVCIPHGAKLLSMAEESLPARELEAFTDTLYDLMESNLKRVEQDLEWFTLKFDYRNQDKPWGESKDAVERSITKLRGWCAGQEPWPETDPHK
jgi:hypothetical protein